MSAGGIRVKRELEDGWFQHVDMPLPALLTIQSGISKLRYATLMGIKKAKSKEVRRVTAESLGVAAGAQRGPRAHLFAGAHQAHPAFRGQPQGSGRATGGETEIRGARHMSILAVLEQRSGQWNRMSFETLAAAQQWRGNSAQPPARRCWGTASRRWRSELASKQLDKVYAIEHELLQGLHARRILRGTRAIDRTSSSPTIVLFPAHLPGSRFPAQAGHRGIAWR